MTVPLTPGETRVRLRDFDALQQANKSLEAAWLARHLSAGWPRSSPPAVLHLLRRDATTDLQWSHLHDQLDAAAAELGAYGIPVTIEFAELDIAVYITDAAQEALFPIGTAA